jgi:hypothetical protein
MVWARTDPKASVRLEAAYADREANRDLTWARTDPDALVRQVVVRGGARVRGKGGNKRGRKEESPPAFYIRVSSRRIARTWEETSWKVFADYAADGSIVGVEVIT